MRTQLAPPPTRKIGLGHEPDQMTGLGQTPLDFIQCGTSLMPELEFSMETIQLPITDAEIASNFGASHNLLGSSDSPNIVVDSTFLNNNPTLQVDLLCSAIGLHFYSEPVHLAQIGVAVPTSASAPVWALDVFTQNDLLNGALGLPAVTAGVTPAVMEWGLKSQLAAYEMSNAYEFVLTMYQRLEVIQEMASTFAYYGSCSGARAAGTADADVNTFSRKINAVYRSLGSPSVFQPTCARRVGSLTTTAPTPVGPAGGGNIAVSHDTSDFALAPSRLGGFEVQSGPTNFPRRRLPKPILFEAGITIGAQLRSIDSIHLANMQQYMSISQGLGGLTAVNSFDTVLNGITNVGGPGTGLELTVDPTPVNVTQTTNTNRTLFQGGDLQVFFGLYGWELWGCWKQWACQNWQGCISIPTMGNGSPSGTNGLPARR